MPINDLETAHISFVLVIHNNRSYCMPIVFCIFSMTFERPRHIMKSFEFNSLFFLWINFVNIACKDKMKFNGLAHHIAQSNDNQWIFPTGSQILHLCMCSSGALIHPELDAYCSIFNSVAHIPVGCFGSSHLFVAFLHLFCSLLCGETLLLPSLSSRRKKDWPSLS